LGALSKCGLLVLMAEPGCENDVTF
jgi:hypothetical protein